MRDVQNQSYYEILEISPDASQEEIHRAYQRARNTYGSASPALYSIFNKQEAQELLRLVDEAYTVLSDQHKRRKYDQEARKAGKVPGKADVSSKNSSDEADAPSEMEKILDSLGGTPTGSVSKAAQMQSAPNAPIPTRPEPGRQPPVKIGPGTTRFGPYKVDPAMESKIESMSDFDGPVLQRIRTYKNISADQMSEAIRVGRHYLVAIEANDFASLPAIVFVRGFIVQIAKILGLDTEKVSKSYLAHYKSFRK